MQNKYIKISVILTATVGVIAAFYFYWRDNSLWRAAREEQKKYAAVEAFMNRYDAAMKADTWGGKTPEETLKLFITALEKGDLDLAAKYFMLETNENDPDYLTRRKWEEALRADQDRLGDIVALLKSAQPAGSSLAGYFGFEIRNERGELLHDVAMRLNEQSNVWKVESL